MNNNSFKYEEDISGISSKILTHLDTTSFTCLNLTQLETAGHANCTAAFILDISKFQENTFYLQSTNGPATNAGTTGLTVFFQARPESSITWITFRAETGAQTTGMSAFRIIGSGATLANVTHFKDIKITVQNTTDSSGTATVRGYMLQRTPL